MCFNKDRLLGYIIKWKKFVDRWMYIFYIKIKFIIKNNNIYSDFIYIL